MRKGYVLSGLIIANVVLIILVYLAFFENYLAMQYLLLILVSFMLVITIGVIISNGQLKHEKPVKRKQKKKTKKQLQDEAVLRYLEKNPDLKERLDIKKKEEIKLRPTETEIKDISQEEKDEFVEENLQILHSDFKDNFKDKKNIYMKKKLQEKTNVILPKGKPNKTNVANIENHIDKLKNEKKEQERREIREEIEERLREREKKQIDETIKLDLQKESSIIDKLKSSKEIEVGPIKENEIALQEKTEEIEIEKKTDEANVKEKPSQRQLAFKYFNENPSNELDAKGRLVLPKGILKKYPKMKRMTADKYFRKWSKKRRD